MIVWLASYPRSGNTLLRIVLNRAFGVRSSVVYDHDGVADRLGAGLVGAEASVADYAKARASGLHFIKTHRQRDHRIADADAAICIFRDGRDALASYAHLLADSTAEDRDVRLRELILTDTPSGTGGWGDNVLSWLDRPLAKSVTIRFEDLAGDPHGVASRAMAAIAPEIQPLQDCQIPSFNELATADPGFFRRGRPGAWRDEMRADLHDLFWSRSANLAAMKALGYT